MFSLAETSVMPIPTSLLRHSGVAWQPERMDCCAYAVTSKDPQDYKYPDHHHDNPQRPEDICGCPIRERHIISLKKRCDQCKPDANNGEQYARAQIHGHLLTAFGDRIVSATTYAAAEPIVRTQKPI